MQSAPRKTRSLMKALRVTVYRTVYRFEQLGEKGPADQPAYREVSIWLERSELDDRTACHAVRRCEGARAGMVTFI